MDKILIGIVAKPQGLKGEIKINPITDDINRFKKLTYVYIDSKKFDIEYVSVRGQFVVIKVKGINSCEQVDIYRQKNVEVDRIDAVELKPNEYFMVDLIGCNVIKENGEVLGKVTYFDKFGARFVATCKDIYNKEFMFPFLDDILVEVNVDKKFIMVNDKFDEVRV